MSSRIEAKPISFIARSISEHRKPSALDAGLTGSRGQPEEIKAAHADGLASSTAPKK